MRRRTVLAAAGWGTAAAAAARPALGQTYPDRPVRMFIPFTAGGPADLLGRIFAEALGARLGQPVVPENRPGVGGVTALEAAARAAPDGHTLVLPSLGGVAISPALPARMPLDVLADLWHVSLVARVPEALAVHPASGINGVPDLAALARGKEGGAVFGSAGVGSITHLAPALLAKEAGFPVTHVPYRGIAPAVTDLLARRVDFVVADVPVLKPHVDAGALRPLAVTTGARLGSMPGVPTTAELGLPRVLSDNWYGLAAPSAVAGPVRARLVSAVAEALRDPVLNREYARVDAIASPMAPEATLDFLRAETAKWAPLVRETGAASL
jgi:tripartite-type tricarboxylate transporter receptor subunit TctC